MAHSFLMNRRICVFIALFLAVTYFAVLDNYPPITADQTTYILLGSALASGRGYREIWVPQEGAHTTYPPVYPLLLSCILRLKGFDPYFMRLMNFCFLAFALFFVYQLLRRRVDGLLSSAIILMTGIHTCVVWSVYHIFSESAFLFFSFLALYCCEQYRRDDRLVSVWACGVAGSLCAAVMTRLAGIPLIAAVGLYLFFEGPGCRGRKMRLGQAFTVILPSVILLLLWGWRNYVQSGLSSLYFTAMNHSPWDYDMQMGIFEKVARSVYAYLFYSLPHAATGADFRNRSFISVVITAVFLIGFVRRCRGQRNSIEYYTGMYLIGMLIWPGVTGSRRYMVPIIPVVIFYFLEGCIFLSQRLCSNLNPEKTRQAAALVLSGVFLFRLPLFISTPVNYREYTLAQATAFLRTADWIRKNTRANDVVIGLHTPDIYLYTGRKSLSLPLETLSSEQLKQYLYQHSHDNVSYLLLSSVYHRYGILQSRAYWLLDASLTALPGTAHRIGVNEVYRRGQEAVYKLTLADATDISNP